ncbi:MAG: hypothetical protein IKW76_03855 [Clostridia bacterium]|nr:hypothetical protein [Clostridia bacterium]
MAEKKPDNERRSVREMLGLKGGHREYKINGVTYVVSGQYHEEKKDGTDKTFADRIEDFIGSEFAELTDIDEEPNLKKNNARRAAGKER